MEIDISIDKKSAKKLRNQNINFLDFAISILALISSVILGLDVGAALALAALVFFSIRIFQEDLKNYRVRYLDLLGVFIPTLILHNFGISLEVNVLQAIIFFTIGWILFQVFDGKIGGGDVRLLATGALFLSYFQILSAVSLAAIVGILIGDKFKNHKVPFASLLIAAYWISYFVVWL